MITAAAVSTDWTVHYADHTSTTFVPGSDQGNVATPTTTVIVAAPAGSAQRQIKMISIVNRSSSATQTISISKDVSGTEYRLFPSGILTPGESLIYTDTHGWQTLDSMGRVKVNNSLKNGITGFPVSYLKIGTAAEAAGAYHSWAFAGGNPSAWSVGTSGLPGRATDGTTTADNGCLSVPTFSGGSNYLTNWTQSFSASGGNYALLDHLWVNNGIVVTTTTAQTIDSVTFPARDAHGSSNGEGLWVGLLATATTGNAGVITNTTLSYTNSDNVSGRTATIASVPATVTLGTYLWFNLQSGDKGVRSIQTLTLGTSYVSGSLSLVTVLPLAMAGGTTVNVPITASIDSLTGVCLYPGVCILVGGVTAVAGAATLTGSIQVSNR